MRELPTDCRSDLCYLLGGAKPVEARHQRSVQACRDGQSGGRNRRRRVLRRAFASRFQHGLRHLLHE